MDRFEAMRAFVRVVETGSFTRAADTLRIGRTQVTQRVQQLEAHLRVTLLNRTTRRVDVTADGAQYYARALRLLADLDDAEASVTAATDTPRGRLRVDLPAPLARLVVVPALADFHARYPDIQLEMGVSDREVALIDAQVDCVVRGGALADPSLVGRRIGALQLGVYAAPRYLARAGTPAHPRELHDPVHRIVGYGFGAGRGLGDAMQRGAERAAFGGRAALAVDDGNAYLEAGLVGLGILALPRYMADPHVADGGLVRVFADWRVASMPLYLAYRPSPHVSPRQRVFIDWMVALMAAQPSIAVASLDDRTASQ